MGQTVVLGQAFSVIARLCRHCHIFSVNFTLRPAGTAIKSGRRRSRVSFACKYYIYIHTYICMYFFHIFVDRFGSRPKVEAKQSISRWEHAAAFSSSWNKKPFKWGG